MASINRWTSREYRNNLLQRINSGDSEALEEMKEVANSNIKGSYDAAFKLALVYEKGHYDKNVDEDLSLAYYCQARCLGSKDAANYLEEHDSDKISICHRYLSDLDKNGGKFDFDHVLSLIKNPSSYDTEIASEKPIQLGTGEKEQNMGGKQPNHTSESISDVTKIDTPGKTSGCIINGDNVSKTGTDDPNLNVNSPLTPEDMNPSGIIQKSGGHDIIEKKFKPARNVYYHSSYKNCFNHFKKEKSGLDTEFDNKNSNFVKNLIEINDLNAYLKKHNTEDSKSTKGMKKTKHHIYRTRLTDGEHQDLGLVRIYFCYAEEISALSSPGKINSKDIVLLYFTYDEKGHDGLKSIYRDLDVGITAISENDIEKFKELEIIKNNLVYKYVLNRDNEYNAIPVLSLNQQYILDSIMLHPPCIIHGSAGSGKTVISEELYAKFSEDNSKTLYVTYMDQLKIQVKYDLENVRNITNTDCKTIDDIVRDYLGEDVFKHIYKKESDFKKWVLNDNELNRLCLNNKYKDGVKGLLKKINTDEELAVSIAYIFFRTYSTETDYRSFKDNPKKGDLKDQDHFLKQCADEKGLSDEQKKHVFFLCQSYENYLKVNGFMNDNEAARRIADKKIGQYDNIIVDEVQDLTETQIISLTTLLKEGSWNFFLFGDDNQSINPTMMDLSNVRQCLRGHLNKTIDFPENISSSSSSLDSSFRSTKYIVNYINYINGIRRKSIATGKAYNEKEQKSALGDIDGNVSDFPAYVLDAETEGLSDSCLSQKDLVVLNDVVIITANERTKQELFRRYPHLDPQSSGGDYVCTIEETKGREWNQVILYDFFTSADSIWDDITRAGDDDADGSIGRHSSIYRMYFNRYYVGLTRAKNKVIIMETGDISAKIRNTYFPSDNSNVSLEHLIDKSGFNSYFENEHTHDVWDQDALNCFKRRDFEEAIIRQRKAIAALDADDSIADKDVFKNTYEVKIKRYTAYGALSRGEHISAESAKDLLPIFIEDKDLGSLKKMYAMAAEKQKIKLMDLDPEKDSDGYLNIFGQLKYDTTIENEFFNSNAVFAYREKIFRLLKSGI